MILEDIADSKNRESRLDKASGAFIGYNFGRFIH
jgi:hypothetical protein